MTGARLPAVVARSRLADFTDAEVVAIREAAALGVSAREMAPVCGVSGISVAKLVTGNARPEAGGPFTSRAAMTALRTALAAAETLADEPPPEVATRFLRRLVPMPSGCWYWPGWRQPSRNPAAPAHLPRFQAYPGGVYAHHFAWRLWVGEIEGPVDHTCKNALCIRGSHLVLGSGLEVPDEAAEAEYAEAEAVFQARREAEAANTARVTASRRKRARQRDEADGFARVHHGKDAGYQRGCRCPACRKANTARKAEYRDRVKNRGEAR